MTKPIKVILWVVGAFFGTALVIAIVSGIYFSLTGGPKDERSAALVEEARLRAEWRDPAGIVVGTPADSVLEYRGKCLEVKELGRDQEGLLIAWVYDDATYVFRRWKQDGVYCYRVTEIKPADLSRNPENP
jgi:hypothetical protein